MKYVVMECHTSYAVVLADDGRFLNVANMHYEVGQSVNDVFEMQLPAPMPVKKKHIGRWVTAITAVAACLLLLFTGVFQNLQMPYASVYLSINPSVRMDVKKDNKVIDIEGMNADGVQLIEGYVYDDKHLDLVTEELIDLAIQMGYLSDGDEIRLTFDADDDEWEVHTGQVLTGQINDMLTDKISVTIKLGDDDDEDDEFENVVIPITPDGDDNYTDDAYGDVSVGNDNTTSSGNNNGDNSGGTTNKPVGGNNSGDSAYDDTVSQPKDDGVTDYVPPVDNSNSGSGSGTNSGTGSDTGVGTGSNTGSDSGYGSSGDSGYTSSGGSNYSSSGDSGYSSSRNDSRYESSDDD